MKKIMKSLALGAALFILGASVAWAESRIGTVDFARLMELAPHAKAASTKLEAEFGPREQELLSLQRKSKELEDRLARDGAVMSESERSKLEREIVAQSRDLKRSEAEFREDVALQKNEAMGRLQRVFFDAITSVAKQQKFDMVLEKSAGVIYSTDQVDLTDKVLERLKSDFAAGKTGE